MTTKITIEIDNENIDLDALTAGLKLILSVHNAKDYSMTATGIDKGFPYEARR